MTSKKLLCPQCEDERLVEKLSSSIEVNVKGELISVPVELYRCLDCGDKIEDPKNPQDELDLAYRQYRNQHNMLQPEQIKKLRKQYGLTQNELAILTGLSPATISRYEQGALQERAQDNALGLLKDPLKVSELLESNSAEFEAQRCLEITNKIHQLFEENPYQYIVKSLELYGESEFTGYSNFDIRKYIATIQKTITLCPKDSISKTKLNKLLFYIDYGHYKHHQKSITGIPYTKEYYGPCPQHFQTLLEMMQSQDCITTHEFGNAEMVSVGENKINWKFSDTEKKFILKVAKELGGMDGAKLSNISHKEKAWEVPEHKTQITYEFSKYLKRM